MQLTRKEMEMSDSRVNQLLQDRICLAFATRLPFPDSVDGMLWMASWDAVYGRLSPLPGMVCFLIVNRFVQGPNESFS